VDVGEDEVGDGALDLGQRRLRGFDHHHAVPEQAQRLGQRVAHGGLVLDDKYRP
jgi:hypothetical protein